MTHDTLLKRTRLGCPCGADRFSKFFTYDSAPAGETRFGFSSSGDYHREVWRCGVCGHFLSIHDMDTSDLYGADYVNSTYGEDGLRQALERVTSLDAAESDNAGRVKRVLDFASAHLDRHAEENRPPTVLDVGSGICVFLQGMKQAGWDCTALDTDARSVAHAHDVVGVEAVCGDFMEAQDLGRFDLVTFNKVLEHVEDPGAMLAKSAVQLREGGLVYVELPDGEAAAADGQEREEFFIEHHHVFSFASFALLAARWGFSVRAMQRVREPSTKYTLWAFLSPAPRDVAR